MFLNKFVFLPYDVILDDLGDPVYVLWLTRSQTFKLILFSNLSTLSLPDGGYSTKASCALNFITSISRICQFYLFICWCRYKNIKYTKIDNSALNIHFSAYLVPSCETVRCQVRTGITVCTLFLKLCLRTVMSLT